VPATALVPTATELSPFAVAFTPQPSDVADADAPLLLEVTLLTTGTNVGVTSVRMGAVVTLSPLTKLAVVVPVTAGADVVATLDPVVKNWLVVGGLKPVTTPSAVPVPFTTVCVFGVPLTTGTVNSEMLPPPPLGRLTKSIAALLFEVVLPLPVKANPVLAAPMLPPVGGTVGTPPGLSVAFGKPGTNPGT